MEEDMKPSSSVYALVLRLDYTLLDGRYLYSRPLLNLDLGDNYHRHGTSKQKEGSYFGSK